MNRSHALQDLDLPHLVRQTFGDRTLERELLRLFDQQCQRLLPVIAEGHATISRLEAAHTLKGAAVAVGANRVGALAEAIELALADGRAGVTIGRLAVKLAIAIDEARRAIAAR